MCGRFQLSVKGKEISERFNVEVFEERYTPSYNCAPSQLLPVIANSNPKKVSFYRWGFMLPKANEPKTKFTLINTRAETIDTKPLFKEAFERRRCLIPANGFYEWRSRDKAPFRIFLANEPLFSMAGIWDYRKDNDDTAVYSFSIITTRANKKMSALHHRMPVILDRSDEEEWLHGNDRAFLKKILEPYAKQDIEMYRVSTKINSPKNISAEVALPARDGEQLGLF